MDKKISFFGLGAMGTPMAGFLTEKYKVVVYNRTPEKALPLKYFLFPIRCWFSREKGAEIASTIEEAITKGDILVRQLNYHNWLL